jgi:hypothetical protein
VEKQKISGSALSYAILFVLLLSLIAGGLISVFSAFNRQNIVFQTNENLFFDNRAALKFAELNSAWKVDSVQYLHPSGDTSLIKRKKWGLFDGFAIRTYKGNQEVSGFYLLGSKSSSAIPGLVQFSGSEGLKITGKTKLEGSLFISNGKIERAYIAGKNFEYQELYHGKLNETKEHHWELKANLFPDNISFTDKEERVYSGQNINQTFFDKTILFSGASANIHSMISGNVILNFTDSITIESSSNLENVCVYAPLVRIKKGFKGSMQIFATEKVILEDSVALNYPSSIVVKGKEGSSSNSIIHIGEYGKLIGGIVLITENFDFRNPPRLIVSKNATVGGIVYNVGTTELYGGIFGHIYTGDFECKVAGGVYTNHLVDATISSRRVPARFGIPKILSSQEKLPTITLLCNYEK